MCENLRKGKGKKEAPQVLERGFSPITKVTGFQPIYLSMKNIMKNIIDFTRILANENINFNLAKNKKLC